MTDEYYDPKKHGSPIAYLQMTHEARISDEVLKLIENDPEVAKRNKELQDTEARLSSHVPGFGNDTDNLGLPPEIGLQVIKVVNDVLASGARSIKIGDRVHHLTISEDNKFSRRKLDTELIEAEIGLLFKEQLDPNGVSKIIEEATGMKGENLESVGGEMMTRTLNYRLGRVEAYQEPEKVSILQKFLKKNNLWH